MKSCTPVVITNLVEEALPITTIAQLVAQYVEYV
jgi:hypothetical protein